MLKHIIKSFFAVMLVMALLLGNCTVATADWDENEHGNWQYIDEDGNYLTGWHNDIPGWEKQWFYFNDDGTMVTGWFKDPESGEWYYFNDDKDDESKLGQLATGSGLASVFLKNQTFFIIAIPTVAAIIVAASVVIVKKRKRTKSAQTEQPIET